jgi:Short-chain dehydrogenases of various substrate specificities
MHVIVTGGSSGIGLEVSRLYASRGARVTLIARDRLKLQVARDGLLVTAKSAPDDIQMALADVGDEAAIRDAVQHAESRLGPCDVLIACAGIVEPAVFEDLSSDRFNEQIRINLLGTVNAVRSVYTGMKQRGQGRIMIVSSGAGLIGIHGYSAYCASKAALTGFAEALAQEGHAHGITVGICFPPDTQTPQLERELPKRPIEAQRLMGKAGAWTAEAVARKIVRSIDRRSGKLYFGFSLGALGVFGGVIKPVLFWWYRRRA